MVVAVLILSCVQKQSKHQQLISNDPINTSSENSSFLDDSLRLAAALNEAFRIARPQFSKDTFSRAFIFHPGDSSYEIENQVEIGRIFRDEHKYFLLRRIAPFGTLINVYRLDGENPTEVIFREQGGMSYVEDLVSDVNGDGHRDFLVHWYPASGCCRRDIYSVYVYQPKENRFSDEYEFMNPTFFPKDQVVLGVEYGHPGEVGMYKYEWNGFQLDTVEHIYPHPENRNQFIKTRKPLHITHPKDYILLQEVPLEYRNITSYEWFSAY